MKRQTRQPIIPELLFSPFNKTSKPLTVAEVAAVTGYDPATVRRHARMGMIPGALQSFGKGGGWRFKRKEFEQWWNAQGGQR